MANLEEDVIPDQEDTTSELNDTADSKTPAVSDDDTSDDRKSNSSNWKRMNEAKKQLAKELRSEREEKAALAAELVKVKEWANSLYEDESQRPFTKKEEKKVELNDQKADKLEQKIFLLENKEAAEHIDDVNSVRTKYWMDFEEAWTFVKAKLPAESKSKKDFDTASKATKLQKDLTKISPEDALSLSKEEQTKWRKVNKWE